MAKQTQDFEKLLDDYFSQLPQAGDLVEGTVVSMDNGAVRIDINGLTTGVVRGPELFQESQEYANIAVGDTVHATVLEQENEQGEMELSFRVAGQQLVWERMKQWMEDEVAVEGTIISANKGGLLVRVDALVAFMPVSQLSPDNYPRVPGGDKNRILEHLRSFMGDKVQIKVIDLNRQEDKLIVSEKAVWEDEQKAVLESYNIGDIVEGEVSALTSFGAFIKFGEGLEGLVHISEIVWQRIDHPRDILKVGDKVKAQIIDLNKSKIYLSMKRLKDDPWKSVKETYKIGEVVDGEIHKIEAFGLMVKLDEQIHGLAHISELSDHQMSEEEMRDTFAAGETKQFEIVSIEPAKHRLGLRLAGLKSSKKKTETSAEPKVEEQAEEAKADEPKEEPEVAEEKTEEEKDV